MLLGCLQYWQQCLLAVSELSMWVRRAQGFAALEAAQRGGIRTRGGGGENADPQCNVPKKRRSEPRPPSDDDLGHGF